MTDIKSEILWEVGKTYKTRGGLDAIIYALHPNQRWAIHGAMYCENEIASRSWASDGKYAFNGESLYDLMPPEPETHVAYLNIYNEQAGGFHSTRKKADENAVESRTACLRIEWKDGQYDE